jgi:hypothetical protein
MGYTLVAPTLPETLPKASRARTPGSSCAVDRTYASFNASKVLMSIAEYGNTPSNPICIPDNQPAMLGDNFGDSQQGPDSMRAYRPASIRASLPLPVSVAVLQYCSSSGFSQFQPGICLTKNQYHKHCANRLSHTELTRETADPTRHEPTETADLTSVFNMVPVRGKHPFLRS